MARNKLNQTNIDNSDPTNYPNGRIKDNTGAGNGTPVNEATKGDIHEFFDKCMRLYGIVHNGLPDNENNGHQFVEAVRALASKNDFVLDLGESGGRLTVPLRIGNLQNDESFILRATVNRGSETQIRGTLDNQNKSVTVIGAFQSGEYVRMINTASSVILVRMVDAVNLDTFAAALGFLKAANQTQENAGTINTVASSPLTALTAFIRRVNGSDSGTYLATNARNGIMSAAHVQAVEAIGDPLIVRRGEVGSTGNVLQGTGFTSTFNAVTGLYRITHNIGNVNYIVMGAGTNAANLKISMQTRSSNFCDVGLSDDASLNPGAGNFGFIIVRTV